MARTNIVLDDSLLQEARELTGLRTKREIVETALLELVRRRRRREMLDFEGKLIWRGNLDTLRERRK